jgi:hypothetical protein
MTSVSTDIAAVCDVPGGAAAIGKVSLDRPEAPNTGVVDHLDAVEVNVKAGRTAAASARSGSTVQALIKNALADQMSGARMFQPGQAS